MKAYSIDFRQKIIDTYQQEKISQRKLANRFNVALSFIYKLLKQYRETGNIEPLPHGGGVQFKLNEEQIAILGELIEKNNDATLEELRVLLHEKTQITISRATIGRYTSRLKYTVKKNFTPN